MSDTKINPLAGERQPTQAGDSLEQMKHAAGDRFIEKWIGLKKMSQYIFLVCLLMVPPITAWEYYFPAPPPSLATVIILFAVCYPVLAYLGLELKKEIEGDADKLSSYVSSVEQGRMGERYVAQRLEEMRADGYLPIHDINFNNKFNIDHVLVGRQGVFVIETKTWSKEAGTRNTIEYRGGNICKCTEERCVSCGSGPIEQVLWNKKDIEKLLRDRLGKDVPVYSIIAFPKFFVDPGATSLLKSEKNIYILSADAIRGYVGTIGGESLSDLEKNEVYNSLCSYAHKEIIKEV